MTRPRCVISAVQRSHAQTAGSGPYTNSRVSFALTSDCDDNGRARVDRDGVDPRFDHQFHRSLGVVVKRQALSEESIRHQGSGYVVTDGAGKDTPSEAASDGAAGRARPQVVIGGPLGQTLAIRRTGATAKA